MEIASGMSHDGRYLAVLREVLEVLQSIELLEYHDKNWLPQWAIQSPRVLVEQKIGMIRRGLQALNDYECPPPVQR